MLTVRRARLYSFWHTWKRTNSQSNNFPAAGTFILKGGPVDEAQTLLDDHIVKSQAMTASPFAKPFIDRLGPWVKKLERFQVCQWARVSWAVGWTSVA